jgi:hypothetical protein
VLKKSTTRLCSRRRWRPTQSQRLRPVSARARVISSPPKLTQHAVCGDRSNAPAAVRPVWLDGQLPLLAWAHIKQALVPSFDDLSLSDNEAEGLAAVVRCVKLASVRLEGAAVVHVDLVACYGRAIAFDGFDDFGLEVFWIEESLVAWQWRQ